MGLCESIFTNTSKPLAPDTLRIQVRKIQTTSLLLQFILCLEDMKPVLTDTTIQDELRKKINRMKLNIHDQCNIHEKRCNTQRGAQAKISFGKFNLLFTLKGRCTFYVLAPDISAVTDLDAV